MTHIAFAVGVRRASRVAVPRGVTPPPDQFVKLAEQRMELDYNQLQALASGHIEIAFPVAALQGRAGPQDSIAIRVGLPNHNLSDHEPEEEGQ